VAYVAESGIAMLGPTESGKSTFLCALRKALLEQGEDWVVFARDLASRQALDNMSNALRSEGGLPMTTKTVESMRWILSGTVERKERKGRFGGEKSIKDRVELTLRLTDAPGELGRADQVGRRERNVLINQLAESRGIVYMFDPIREFAHGDAFQRAESVLGELIGQVPDFSGKLPHRLAVCVTKLDDPRVFRTALDLNLLIRDDDNRWGFPRVHDADAQTLFRALAAISGSGEGEAVLMLLEQLFHPDRISYFVTSAVGFMVNKRTKRFDPRDTANVYRIGSGQPFVRGPVHPINVVEPVLWIARQLISLG
jgi:hypothetical protein